MRHFDERHAALREVTCERCAAVVRAVKFSPQHTSVQWDASSTAQCAEFTGPAARPANGVRRHVPLRTCASLWESIDRAVRDGRLPVQLDTVQLDAGQLDTGQLDGERSP